MTTTIGDHRDAAADSTTFQQQTYRMSLEAQAAHHLIHNARVNPESTQYRLDTARFSHLLPKYGTSTLRRIINSTPESAITILTIIRRYHPKDEQLNDWISSARIHKEVGGLLPQEVIQGIPLYKHIEKHDGPNSKRREVQVQALVSVIMHFAADYDDYRYSQLTGTGIGSTDKVHLINNEKLSDLITTHEHPNAIAEIITTRNLIDPNQITALYGTMNQSSSAINDGVL